MKTLFGLIFAFMAGYITYPLWKLFRIYTIAQKIDKTMQSIYAEQKEIRDMLNEVDKDWHDKHE